MVSRKNSYSIGKNILVRATVIDPNPSDKPDGSIVVAINNGETPDYRINITIQASRLTVNNTELQTMDKISIPATIKDIQTFNGPADLLVVEVVTGEGEKPATFPLFYRCLPEGAITLQNPQRTLA